jgi:hypothetical protein
MKALTLAEMVEKSDVIVEGRVSDIRSMWNENQTMIVTYIDITFAPEAVLKDNPNENGQRPENKITLKLWGGIVGDITTVVLGNPSLYSRGQIQTDGETSEVPRTSEVCQ